VLGGVSGSTSAEFTPAALLALVVPQGERQGPGAPVGHDSPSQPHLGPPRMHKPKRSIYDQIPSFGTDPMWFLPPINIIHALI